MSVLILEYQSTQGGLGTTFNWEVRFQSFVKKDLLKPRGRKQLHVSSWMEKWCGVDQFQDVGVSTMANEKYNAIMIMP